MRGTKHFIPVILWALVILVLSILPSNELPDTAVKFADKAAHLGVYAILSFLMVVNYRSYAPAVKIGRKLWSVFFFLSAIYGISIEVVQECFIPSRFGEWQDAVANGAGSFLGLVVGFFRLKAK